MPLRSLLFSLFFFSWQKVLATPVEQTEMATISKIFSTSAMRVSSRQLKQNKKKTKEEVTAPGTHTNHMQHVCLFTTHRSCDHVILLNLKFNFFSLLPHFFLVFVLFSQPLMSWLVARTILCLPGGSHAFFEMTQIIVERQELGEDSLKRICFDFFLLVVFVIYFFLLSSKVE